MDTETPTPTGAETRGGVGTDDLVLALRPGTVAVDRGDGTVQVGLAPDRAVFLVPPRHCSPAAVVDLLRALDGTRTLTDAAARAGFGHARLGEVREVLGRLVDLGHLRVSLVGRSDPGVADHPMAPVRRVHLFGTGPVAHILRGPLQLNGCRVWNTGPSGVGVDPLRPPWRREGRDPDLVVLTDAVVPDPLVTSGLLDAGVPHLHVHCREGRVVVGPTVLPGRSPCLRCLDLYRTDRDPRWPHVAARLLGHGGSAPVPALTAAAALVLSEVSVSREPGGRPQTVGATVEISPAEGLWRRRRWPAHQRCRCGAAAACAPLS